MEVEGGASSQEEEGKYKQPWSSSYILGDQVHLKLTYDICPGWKQARNHLLQSKPYQIVAESL